jgi:hypothetical protein
VVTGPVAVLLRCPNCGSDLPGLDADRAWACAPCGNAWEIDGTALAPRPYRVWRLTVDGRVVSSSHGAEPREARRSGSAAGAAPVVWLPFWRVAYRPEIECGEGDFAVRAAIERAAASGRAWVRAFWLDGAFQTGDPGQTLTNADHAEHIEADRLPDCVGARIGSAEAVRLATLFVLARADREEDVTPAVICLDVSETALVAVPFLDAGRDLVCAVDARSYRKSAMGM